MSQAADLPIVHSVYFTLKERTQPNLDALLADCNEYLSEHPGVRYFAASVRGEGFDRPVNDQGFDAAILVVFDDREAHDNYQKAPRHQEFLQRNKESWAQVRVFDSLLS